MTTPQDVLNFWFREIDPQLWFTKDKKFDDLLKSRFSEVHARAARGETYEWRITPQGRLAEIIVLDQFSRNMFRETAASFAYDPVALTLAQELVFRKDDEKLSTQERAFAYLPYMHSESKVIHEQAVKLFSLPGLESNLDFEYKHKRIIDRFGRFPHRNKVLGRTSTPEELHFLTEPGSSF